MRTNAVRSLIVLLFVSLISGIAAPANADTIECTGYCTFGPNDEIDDLVVKNGGVAKLDGTRVTGNIKVLSGGTLCMKNGVEVEGNVQSENAKRVDVRDSFVDGDIQLKKTKKIYVKNTTIGGNLQLQENIATLCDTQLCNNTIDGDLQLDKNRFTGFKAKILNNIVLGNLQLVDNTGGKICVKNNYVESALQCDDNSSQVVGYGNDAGDLECEHLG